MLRSGFDRHNGWVEPHYDSNEFNEMGFTHGSTAIYWQSVKCSCKSERGDLPDLVCSLCGGIGYYFVNQKTLTVSNLSDNTKRIYEAFGTYEPGDLMVSFPTLTDSGDRVIANTADRFYFEMRVDSHSDIKVKGEKRLNQSTSERIWSPSVQRVVWCASVSEIFTFGTDFTLINDDNLNGTIINWIAGKKHPQEGERYSINYEAAPFYHVTDVKFRTEFNQRMPQLLKVVKVWSPWELINIRNATSIPVTAVE